MFLFNQGLWDKSRSKRSTQLQPKGKKRVIIRKFGYSRVTSGFTVLELIAAMAIASVVLGIAVPSLLAWLPTLRLSSAARQVATDLQVARMKAISQNAAYTVSFNTTNGTYSFTGTSRDLGQEYPGITIASVSPSPPNPVFSPRGTANAATTITLSNGSAQKWVCVKTVGRVNLQDSTCT